MCLYTSDEFTGMQKECDEVKLEWIPKEKLEVIAACAGQWRRKKQENDRHDYQ